MHIGLDDTDSTKGGCTTYLTAVLIEKLVRFNVRFIDYPALIRLNPNVPWKTRGNGALCLRFTYDDEFEAEIKETALSLWSQQSVVKDKGTDPGIVFYKNHLIPNELRSYSKKAQTSIVHLSEAKSLIKRIGAEAYGLNSCRGIIGALASIGETLERDHTFEVIAYRKFENIGTKRLVDEASIFEMEKLTAPYTFNNVDVKTGRIIITPRGPDPILFGIRGETPTIVKNALGYVKCLEPIERWVIFCSNQGTDSHLRYVDSLHNLEPYSSVIVKGTVSKNPRLIPVRHVIFSIKDDFEEIDCAAYEPTGDLRKNAMHLQTGDFIEVYGAINEKVQNKTTTINLEKINILSLNMSKIVENPFCPNCNKRLKSMGRNQGFRCEKCGSKFSNLTKKENVLGRVLKPGLYFTSTRSQRHLTKPFRRYGQEKHNPPSRVLIEGWHSEFISV